MPGNAPNAPSAHARPSWTPQALLFLSLTTAKDHLSRRKWISTWRLDQIHTRTPLARRFVSQPSFVDTSGNSLMNSTFFVFSNLLSLKSYTSYRKVCPQILLLCRKLDDLHLATRTIHSRQRGQRDSGYGFTR
jgi:hypothetical protein